MIELWAFHSFESYSERKSGLEARSHRVVKVRGLMALRTVPGFASCLLPKDNFMYSVSNSYHFGAHLILIKSGNIKFCLRDETFNKSVWCKGQVSGKGNKQTTAWRWEGVKHSGIGSDPRDSALPLKQLQPARLCDLSAGGFVGVTPLRRSWPCLSAGQPLSAAFRRQAPGSKLRSPLRESAFLQQLQDHCACHCHFFFTCLHPRIHYGSTP